MMSTPTVVELIEKIARAKMQLERARRSHAAHCVVEDDPEGYAPCNCRASETNRTIDRALKELTL